MEIEHVINTMFKFWKKEQLRRVVHVASNSMAPLIKAGDCLVAEGCENVSLGEVILYRKRGQLVVHRLVALSTEQESRKFWTKGDANIFLDTPITENEIVGRVIAIERQGNWIDLAQPRCQLFNKLILWVTKHSLSAKRWKKHQWRLSRKILFYLGQTLWLFCQSRQEAKAFQINTPIISR